MALSKDSNEIVEHKSVIKFINYLNIELIKAANKRLEEIEESNNEKNIFIRGVYESKIRRWNDNEKSGFLYDENEYNLGVKKGIRVVFDDKLNVNLKDGAVIDCKGLAKYSINNGYVDLFFLIKYVTEDFYLLEKIDFLNDEQIKRKNEIGRKNIKKQLILNAIKKPFHKNTVCILFLPSSHVKCDVDVKIENIEDGLKIYRDSFEDPKSLAEKLKEVDRKGYDVIAISRGGGNVESLDIPKNLEQIVNMKTPTISAIGHADRTIKLEQIVDLKLETPTDLGNFLIKTYKTVKRIKSLMNTLIITFAFMLFFFILSLFK